MAYHITLEPQPPTPALTATSVPKVSSKDLGGDRTPFKILQDGLKKQAVDTDSRFLQLVGQVAQLAGTVEQIGSLLRPSPIAPGLWNRPFAEGHPTSVPADPWVSGCAPDAASLVVPGNAPGEGTLKQSPWT